MRESNVHFKDVYRRILHVLESKPLGLTYSELCRTVSHVSRQQFDRQLYNACGYMHDCPVFCVMLEANVYRVGGKYYHRCYAARPFAEQLQARQVDVSVPV